MSLEGRVLTIFASRDESTASGAEIVQDVISWLSTHPTLDEVTGPAGDFTIGGNEAQVLTAVGAGDGHFPSGALKTSL